MNANAHYDEDGTVSSFVIKGDRTRWHWSVNNGVATFRRVEVKKDDHSTETHVALFGEEYKNQMEFAESLEFVEETKIQEEIA